MVEKRGHSYKHGSRFLAMRFIHYNIIHEAGHTVERWDCSLEITGCKLERWDSKLGRWDNPAIRNAVMDECDRACNGDPRMMVNREDMEKT